MAASELHKEEVRLGFARENLSRFFIKTEEEFVCNLRCSLFCRFLNRVPIPKLGDLRPKVEVRVTVKSVGVLGFTLGKRRCLPKLNLCYAVEKLIISW